jgi:Tol biopolymer transport system component
MGWRLVWVDREGQEKSLTEQPRALIHLRLSPNGKQVAYDLASGGTRDIWIYDIDRGTHTRLTTEGGIYPVWTPDGIWVAFFNGGNIHRKLADGSGETQEILTRENNTRAISWSPDGRILAFEELNPDTGYDIGYITIEGDDASEPFLVTPFDERSPMISPDGRWLAYISDESGQSEIYVQPFPEAGQKWLISTGGGIEPMWSPDGQELFYRTVDQMMAVVIETEPRFSAGTPRQLYQGRYSLDDGIGHPRYGVSPDGQHFLMGKAAAEEEPGQIKVVLNWFEELKERVPVP